MTLSNLIRPAAIAAIATLLLVNAADAQLSAYSQDFEGMDALSTTALEDDGWFVFGNVFDGTTGNYLYGYGPFVAPNSTADGATDGFRFSLVAENEGSASGDQGVQHLGVLSDYKNGDHVSNTIESNVFKEWTIDAADVGTTWEFSFDANNRDLVAPTTALAFIKTLDPANGFATTNFVMLDTSALTEWGSYTMTLAIDAGLPGQILQIGFANTCTNYDASGVIYDNINFDVMGTGPVVVNPASFNVVHGDYVSGGLTELADSDNNDVGARRKNTDIQSRVTVAVAAASPSAMPTSMTFTVEGAVFARSTVNQNIELFDYDASAWELLDMRAATRIVDSTVVVTATGDLSRFVEPGTMAIEARIRYVSPVQRQAFSANVDQMVWEIE